MTQRRVPPYPITDAERIEQARDEAILREHNAALDRIAEDLLGAVSVAEIEAVVFEMDDNLPAFARRMILMRRQMKRMSDAIQATVGHESRLDTLERIVESYETKRQRGEWLDDFNAGAAS